MEVDRRRALRVVGSLAAGGFLAGCSGKDAHSEDAAPSDKLATTKDDPAPRSTTTTNPRRATALVKKLDHVYVVLDDAEAGADFLRDQLGLPVAWPYANYGGFSSGGMGLGNLNLELIAAAPGFVAERPSRIIGVSFEPTMPIDDALVAALDEREISHLGPAPTPVWTNIGLPDLIGDTTVFATRYHSPGAADEAARRSALEKVDGGPLAIAGVAELRIGATDVDAARNRWQPLLAPAVPAPGEGDGLRWRLGSGPELRIVEHDEDVVLGLTLRSGARDATAALAAMREGNDPLAGLDLTISPR